MMRPDGHTVHATPIENTIASHPYVNSCAVVGIKQGDILLSIDNIEVNTLCEVREILFSKDIDEVVNLRILTNGIEREIPVELIEKI